MNRTCVAVLLFVVGCSPSAFAQLDTGAIVGTVRDQSGAVVPGATVTATQESTGTAAMAVTTDKGQFVFPNLKIGVYSIATELSGFRKSVQTGIALHVQERIEVDVRIELGNVTEEVVVRGKAELLQTQTADVGYAVDQRQVVDLPLLGRRYSELAFLTPGVVTAPGGLTGRGEDGLFNVNGNFATWNNFILDGGDNNSASTNLQERSTEVVQPPVDALEEFRVQTRTYSAEFGKAAGAVINASIKQGSNAFKGSAFEFFRDEAFNANTWENTRAGRAKGQFNQHIAGGTLGGPIVRGRTFFFGDYQATRTDKALTQLATVPTDLMRQGIFTELTGTMIASNPFVPAGCVNAAAKTVAPSCIDPVAASLLALYPRANVPQALAAFGAAGGFVSPNYISNGVLSNDVDQFDTRVDQNVLKGQLFGRYSFMDVTRHEPPVLDDPIASGDFSSDTYNRGQSAVGGWSRPFGGAMFSELRVAWNRMSSSSLQPSFGSSANSRFGIKGIPEDARYSGGIPHMNISRMTRLGGPFFRPQFQTSQVFQFSENLTWNRGAHTYKLGAERRRDKVDYIDLRALNGVLNFTDSRYTGFGLGDFLLGLASNQGLTLFREADLYSDGWQFYGQDSWRAGSNVTFTYGLRYEYFTPMQDTANLMTNIDPATGAILTSTSNGSMYDRTLIHPDRNNVAPRAGIAWNPLPNLVIRGGYGIFYQEYDRYGSESQLALNPPQLIDVSLIANSGSEPPPMILRNGFAPVSAANVDKTRVQWRIQDPNQKTPWVQQFSLGPEYQIGSSTVVGVEYVGNLTRNGRKLRNLNQGMIATPGGGPVVFPYAQYGFANAYLEQIATDGEANYHSLQARIQRRLNRGLAFTSSFTYGRALGNFLDHLSADGGGESGNFPKNVYDLAADYGPLSIDIRKRFVTSFIYELPVGAGRARQLTGLAGALASDWNVNGILTLSDGRPFSITATDRAQTGSGRISRANCVGDPLPSGFDQTIDHWFDVTAFAETTPFTYGSCGPNSVVGPGSKSMNLSLFRSIPWNGKRIELRLESFNTFNWLNYGRPGQNVSNAATFGKIASTQGDPRELQFAVKVYF